ncbi:hypothetical protein BT69DRAFT_1278931 [Atractiella rhizophila]|nr:hypothetical protein BT69DRAFT_1278931 [Atractiella rhizophila]
MNTLPLIVSRASLDSSISGASGSGSAGGGIIAGAGLPRKRSMSVATGNSRTSSGSGSVPLANASSRNLSPLTRKRNLTAGAANSPAASSSSFDYNSLRRSASFNSERSTAYNAVSPSGLGRKGVLGSLFGRRKKSQSKLPQGIEYVDYAAKKGKKRQEGEPEDAKHPGTAMIFNDVIVEEDSKEEEDTAPGIRKTVRFANASRGLGLRSVTDDEALRQGGAQHPLRWVGVGRGRYGNLIMQKIENGEGSDEEVEEFYAEQVEAVRKKWRAFGSKARNEGWAEVRID